MRINNNAFQRNANISMVAQTIWRKPGISRIDIARELNLYRSTVTNIIQTLIDAGVVYEAEEGEVTSLGGRRPILLRINERMGCVLGLELQVDQFRAVLVDVYGTTLHQVEAPIEPRPFPELFADVVERMRPIIQSSALPLLGICAGIPGIVNVDNGTILRSDPFQLNHYPFAKEIGSTYPVPILIENDANCCAWEELARHRDTPLQDFLCVLAEHHVRNASTNLGPGMGVGMALVLGGKLHYGKRYAAGEFTSVLWRPGDGSQFGMTFKEMARIQEDERIYRTFITELFESLKPVVSVFDPEALFLHGDICSRANLIEEIYNEQADGLKKVMDRVDCRLELSSGGKSDVAHGAAAMFLGKLFSVPELSEVRGYARLDWDDIFALIASGPGGKNEHSAQR
ncbi:MAG: ROK family transcriptional regulator [Termitinemataceae bacterium]